MNQTKHKRINGFTLIEVVVAVSIFAVIASLLGPFLQRALEVNSRVSKAEARMADLQRLFVYMDNDFRFIIAHKTRDAIDGLSASPSFSLETDDDELIKFATMHPDISSGESRPRLIAWQLDGDKLQRKVWRSLTPYTEEEPKVFTLADKVEEVSIDVAADDDSFSWGSSWDNDETIPSALQVKVTYEDGNSYRRVFELAQSIDLASTSAAGGTNPSGTNPSGENPGGENPGGENPGGENSNPGRGLVPVVPGN